MAAHNVSRKTRQRRHASRTVLIISFCLDGRPHTGISQDHRSVGGQGLAQQALSWRTARPIFAQTMSSGFIVATVESIFPRAE